ncbi:ribonuclease H-like domain-containing protein [Tanacetum coccineum]|uniref:Ribonuclease H-like domain-containing protein n=1 Tax=Tanacetum coccineum TaxID=301880 RepID=A0ABQ5CCK9_9ASTR
MTGNKSYLLYYEEINGGFVAFGGDTKGGRITVPRKDNMYSVDLKNIVPSGGLTCLFAKATLDESNLWHRRLGHINFKTLNKLVRGNLVRGLPSKIFENNHTCVACQKGKQHKASCALRKSAANLGVNAMTLLEVAARFANNGGLLRSLTCRIKQEELALTGNPLQEVVNFLRQKLMSWQCKKQTIVASFYYEAEDSYEKKLIQVIKIHTDHNVADLLTKAFDVSRFNFLIASIGLISETQKPKKAKRTTEISQSSRPIHLVADETVYKEWEDRMERAATTASSLVAEQDSGSGPRCQDTILGGAEAQIRFEAASKQSNDPPLSRVNTLGSGEDSMKLMELMEHCTKLSELFWASAKAKIVNGERQIQALVDKKKVIITETSIRSDLKLDDAEGIDCLPTALIFAELERMGAKTTAWNEFSSTMASAIICLATNQKFNFSKYIFDNIVKHLEEKVLDLEKSKTAQAKEIASLKKRVKQLEKRRKLRTPRLKRLRKVSSTSRVESSNDVSLGDQEDASKQGRKITDLDADAEVTLVDETQEMNNDNLTFDTDVLEEQEK